jgi:peroxiredoxin
MKSKILLLLLFLPVALTAQNLQFAIEGKLENLKLQNQQIFLFYRLDGKAITDSTIFKNGKYNFKGNVSEPSKIRLYIKSGSSESPNIVANVFIGPEKVQITHVDSFSNIKVNGSKTHDEYLRLEKKLEPLRESFKTLEGPYKLARKIGDESEIKKFNTEYKRINALIREEHLKFFIANPQSPVALYALNTYIPSTFDVSEIEPLFNKLSLADQQTWSGKSLKKRIDGIKSTELGSIAPEFSQNDTSGRAVSLSSFRGKYVLLDFWASWCVPCRAENPNVVKAFNMYKNKGFTVLSVSLDELKDRAKWLKAIRSDGLTWTQVSDLNGWNNQVSRTYGIKSIPQNVLIGPDGKIVGKNLLGDELIKKLGELM